MNDEITQEDIDLGKNIYTVLISQPTILMSWGFESPVVIKQGLQFETNGFIHKGIVEIYSNQGIDFFDIRLLDKQYQIIKLISRVNVYELLEVLDLYIEKVDKYQMRVNQEYNIINNEDI